MINLTQQGYNTLDPDTADKHRDQPPLAIQIVSQATRYEIYIVFRPVLAHCG